MDTGNVIETLEHIPENFTENFVDYLAPNRAEKLFAKEYVEYIEFQDYV